MFVEFSHVDVDVDVDVDGEVDDGHYRLLGIVMKEEGWKGRIEMS